MAGASFQVVKQCLCQRWGGLELSWCVSWVLPWSGAVASGLMCLLFLSAHVSEATLGPPLEAAPLLMAPSYEAPEKRGPSPGPLPSTPASEGGGVTMGSGDAGIHVNRPPLMTGAGSGAGAGAGGLPTGDPEAGGAAPPGSPAAVPGPP